VLHAVGISGWGGASTGQGRLRRALEHHAEIERHRQALTDRTPIADSGVGHILLEFNLAVDRGRVCLAVDDDAPGLAGETQLVAVVHRPRADAEVVRERIPVGEQRRGLEGGLAVVVDAVLVARPREFVGIALIRRPNLGKSGTRPRPPGPGCRRGTPTEVSAIAAREGRPGQTRRILFMEISLVSATKRAMVSGKEKGTGELSRDKACFH